MIDDCKYKHHYQQVIHSAFATYSSHPGDCYCIYDDHNIFLNVACIERNIQPIVKLDKKASNTEKIRSENVIHYALYHELLT